MQAAVVEAGHEVVDAVERADVVVVNSCTITSEADADVRRHVRRALRRAPHVEVILTGCAATADPVAMAALPGVRLVLGNAEKPRLAAALGGSELVALRPAPPRDRVRALLAVQNGCNYRCSFCIVPRVRGASQSRSVPEVIEAVRRLVGSGTPEIVITGAHLGTWGLDLRPRRRLHELVDALLPELGAARLRLSSIDPHEVDDELIALMRDHPGSICRHLHLPVQSGDPSVLRRMRRGHTAEDFERLVGKLHAAMPGIGIGTDVIVGFPGEDDDAFARTHALLRGLPVSYHHVFTYSTREGTPAASLPAQVPPHVKAERNRVLRELSRVQGDAFARACVGQSLDAVVVRGRDGRPRALTDNYLRLPLLAADPPGTRRRVAVALSEGGADVIAR